MEKYYVKVSGIYCNHCRETIEKVVGAIPGVFSVRVRGNVACIITEPFRANRGSCDPCGI